jgi:minor extracellular serine protease Vpr
LKSLKSLKSISGLLLSLTLLFLAALPVQARVMNDDGAIKAGALSNEYAYIQFSGESIASYDGSLSGYEATKPLKGQKVDVNSPEAIKYGKRLEAQRENYKKWLAKHVPQAEVVTEYDVTFNGIGLKLNGATLKDISGGPGAVNANYSADYHKTMSESTSLIRAGSIWEALDGKANAGAGVKVGVIDSGVDNLHPFLQPNELMQYPPGFPKGDTNFTSAKVIVAKVYHQEPWQTAQAVDSHGTHVAGTIAGKAGTMPKMGNKLLSGVAPGAYLGNYNVFPGDVTNAKSLFIAKAVEEAVEDGMDVLNLSLGGTAHKGADLLDMTVNAAVDAGVTVVISAGNSGPGHNTVGSPGTADKVITVAATTNSHSFAMLLESYALQNGSTVATTGTQGGEVKEALAGEYKPWADIANGDKLACAPVGGNGLSGKIALIQRGSCTFATKINNAAASGAVGVIIYQLEGVSEPIPMSTDGAVVPAIMIGNEPGKALVNWSGDRNVTITYPPSEIATVPNLLANFSSWGPTPNYQLKPDVAAPGVNIYSSVVGGGYELYQGTSMAAPHVAGAAAALIAYSTRNQLGWGPEEVKSALMGTAQDLAGSILPNTDVIDPLKAGAGLIDLERAMNPSGMAFPSSLSFGLVRPTGNQSYELTFTLFNPTGHELHYTLESGENISLDTPALTLSSKASMEITARVVNRGVHSGGQLGTPEYVRGYITVSSEDGSIRIPYLYVIDYNR